MVPSIPFYKKIEKEFFFQNRLLELTLHPK